MNLLLALIVAALVFFAYLTIDQQRLAARRKESLRSRLSADGNTLSEAEAEYAATMVEQPSARALSILALLRAMGVNVDEATRKLEPRFGQAGIASPDAPAYYLFAQRILSLVFCVIGLMLLFSKGDDVLLDQVVGVIIIVVGLFGPYLYVKNKIDHRRKKLLRQFPDTLDLLLICVESGLALDAALNRVCGELGRAYPEITEELNRTRLELALINDRVKALMNLGERTNLVAFRSLVAALIQSERFGTSLTDTLRVLSEDFRLLRLSQAEAKAARLPVLLTIPLIFLLMPSFMLIVLGPAIVGFMRNGKEVVGGN